MNSFYGYKTPQWPLLSESEIVVQFTDKHSISIDLSLEMVVLNFMRGVAEIRDFCYLVR